MDSGSWIPQKKEQAMSAFTEETCLYAVIHQYWYVDSYHSLPDSSHCTQQYKTRQSSDLYSILRTKAEVIFMMAYAILINCCNKQVLNA